MEKGIGRVLALVLAAVFTLALAGPAGAVAAADNSAGTAFSGMQSGSALAAPVDEQTAFEDEVIRLTNLERVKNGLWPLSKNPSLTAAARAHNRDMITHNFVSHTGSDGSASYDRALAAGYAPYGWGKAYVGENIAAGLHTPADAVRGWLNSPTHRANMLRPEYREIGVGMARGGAYGTYVTQNFGSSPKSFPAFVNAGAQRVSSRQVVLTVTSETVSAWGSMGQAVAMMISEQPNFAGAAWRPYTAAVQWELSPQAGNKTLYIRLRDANGTVRTTQVQVELQPAMAAATS